MKTKTESIILIIAVYEQSILIMLFGGLLATAYITGNINPYLFGLLVLYAAYLLGFSLYQGIKA